METDKLEKRLIDLCERAYEHNVYTFSGFLGLSDITVLNSLMDRGIIKTKECTIFGGYDDAERVMVRFGNPLDMGYEQEFPIVCIKIYPLNKRFSDELGHRDYLGALLNLGIDRAVTGDIVIGNKEAYLFADENMAEFITKELVRIKHTTVVAEITEDFKNFPKKEPTEMQVQVSSIRVDGIISKVLNVSRNACLEYFRTGRVFINGRECTSNSKTLNSGDVVNVRGNGKFIITDNMKETKKGKINVVVLKY